MKQGAKKYGKVSNHQGVQSKVKSNMGKLENFPKGVRKARTRKLSQQGVTMFEFKRLKGIIILRHFVMITKLHIPDILILTYYFKSCRLKSVYRVYVAHSHCH